MPHTCLAVNPFCHSEAEIKTRTRSPNQPAEETLLDVFEIAIFNRAPFIHSPNHQRKMRSARSVFQRLGLPTASIWNQYLPLGPR